MRQFAFGVLLALCGLMVPHTLSAATAPEYVMEYQVSFLPNKDTAQVKLVIDNTASRLVRKISFDYDKKYYRQFKANGTLNVTASRLEWLPPPGTAEFTFNVKISHQRSSRGGKARQFDAHMNRHWAIFRGDDLFPPAAVVTLKNAQSRASLVFKLPDNWHAVNTGWPRAFSPTSPDRIAFSIDNPHRNFDRPVGWMIAGQIATRRDRLGDTVVSVSGPRRRSFEDQGVVFARMELLTFLHFVWPQFQALIPDLPPKLLIVGAGDPMWRGGLSSPNSLFMHADRPLVSENGSSTVLHEIFHTLTDIRGDKKADWIAEGLAEYYAIALLYRAGGMTEKRRLRVYENLRQRVEDQLKKDSTFSLRADHSTGVRTAMAVLKMHALNVEIVEKTRNRFSLDDVVRRLTKIRKVSVDILKTEVEKILGIESAVLRDLTEVIPEKENSQ